jgi:DNA-binding NtrC family response regulator
MTILVIDDDAVQRTVLDGFLRHAGYRVLQAASADDGLCVVERQPNVDIVLCDVRMSGLDGVEVLRRLRATRPDIAVILMTAYATIGQAVEVVRLGARDYLTKPLDFDELRSKLARYERTRHAQPETRRHDGAGD